MLGLFRIYLYLIDKEIYVIVNGDCVTALEAELLQGFQCDLTDPLAAYV